jgi:predicted nucleic-acid-binding protein
VIALDTNVLVRYIVQDDPAQAAAAAKLIESECSSEEPGLVSSVTLCELVWVLSRGYRASRERIGAVLRTLLCAEELQAEDPDLAWRALGLFQEGSADFADYLAGASNRARGATATYTFDKTASTSDLFTLIEA